MYEIYNEKIYDLLEGIGGKKSNLRIRENEKLGVFVEGLKKFSISSYKEF